MSTRAQIRQIIRTNLEDNGIVFYTDQEINDSIQDCYNEICAKTRCLIKKTTLNWQTELNYYDFLAQGVSDYMGTVSIFNNASNLWLRDDVNIRDLHRIRRDWELWRGQPQFWTPHSLQFTVVCPCLQLGIGTFDLWYYAIAPTLNSDTDVPVIASDMHSLFEQYCTGDLLETAEEASKAQRWKNQYTENLIDYKARCHNLAKAQLLLRN